MLGWWDRCGWEKRSARFQSSIAVRRWGERCRAVALRRLILVSEYDHQVHFWHNLGYEGSSARRGIPVEVLGRC